MHCSHNCLDHHRSTVISLIILIALLSGAVLAQSEPQIKINTFNQSEDHSSIIRHWYHKMGDDPMWSAPQLIMDDWKLTADQRDRRHEPGIQWYRAVVQLDGEQNELNVLALSINSIVSAFELYWDGEMVGQGGIVADSLEDEIPGPFQQTIRIKRELATTGSHVVAIRLSNFHTEFKSPLGFVSIGNHYDFLFHHAYKSSHRIFVGGAFLITGLFCIALFFAGSRHRSYLLFSLYCLISLLFDLYAFLSIYFEINAEYLPWVIWLFRYGFPLSTFFFVTFVIYTYEVPRKWITMPFAVGMLAVSLWLQAAQLGSPIWQTELLPILAGCYLIFSIYRKKTGSVAALIGLIVWRVSKYPLLLFPWIGSQPVVYVAGDIIFLFCIVLSISRLINDQNQQLQETQLRSSRLEVDLLKKNIQPHFILNTLQSIMSWIRKKPENALHLIEALADEFRMINSIADKKLIPLHQEIDLCNTHLKLMGYRLGSTFELQTRDLPENEQVPPMVFHTLVENALTHSFKTQENGTIYLSCEKEETRTTYRLVNSGSRLKDVSRKSEVEIHEGMGIRYIKARLQESYGDRWDLDYTLDDEQWKVTIVVGA